MKSVINKYTPWSKCTCATSAPTHTSAAGELVADITSLTHNTTITLTYVPVEPNLPCRTYCDYFAVWPFWALLSGTSAPFPWYIRTQRLSINFIFGKNRFPEPPAWLCSKSGMSYCLNLGSFHHNVENILQEFLRKHSCEVNTRPCVFANFSSVPSL